MTASPGRVLLIFLDGVGVGDADPETNPFLQARLPTLRAMLGGGLPVREDIRAAGSPVSGWVAADATLGIRGRPQSGTGQTTLLTGVNAAERFGRHFGPWVPTGLRDMLAAENLLTRARAAGRVVAFANAYPRGYLEGPRRRPAAPPLAAQAAGVLDRHEEALRTGRAVSSSITNDGWRRFIPDLAPVSAQHAGATLATIAANADLTLYAHYDTDVVGHRLDLAAAVPVLERVDAFLDGLLQVLPDDTLVIITSDHGNVEDATTGHTLNPVPVIAAGPGSDALLGSVISIADVTPRILALLGAL